MMAATRGCKAIEPRALALTAMCALPPRRSTALLIETYFLVLIGRVLAHDLKPLGGEGTHVCATAASNPSDTHAAPTATHSAVTRASLTHVTHDPS